MRKAEKEENAGKLETCVEQSRGKEKKIEKEKIEFDKEI